MAYDPYAPIDMTNVAKLSFPYSACNYVYSSNANGVKVVELYKINQATFDKIGDILKGNDKLTIKKGDKVFVLPGHSLAHVRLKEYFKKIGATMVKEIERATVVASSSDFYQVLSRHDNQGRLSNYMMAYSMLHKLNDNGQNPIEDTFKKIGDSDGKLLEAFKKGEEFLCSREVFNTIRWDHNYDEEDDVYLITANALNTMYYILSKGLPIVTEEYVTDNANSGMKFSDPKVVESIRNMLASSDNANSKLGVSILTHCDLGGDTLYELWRLAKDYGHVVANGSRGKTHSHFLETTEWMELQWMSNQDFLMYAEREKQLTDEILHKYMPDIFQDIKDHAPVEDVREGDEGCDEEDLDDYFEMIVHDDYSYTIQLREKWKVLLKRKDNEPAKL